MQHFYSNKRSSQFSLKNNKGFSQQLTKINSKLVTNYYSQPLKEFVKYALTQIWYIVTECSTNNVIFLIAFCEIKSMHHI